MTGSWSQRTLGLVAAVAVLGAAGVIATLPGGRPPRPVERPAELEVIRDHDFKMTDASIEERRREYERIIRDYPNTKFARTAREHLELLPDPDQRAK